jgi:signal transduction histidine kinase
MKRWFSDTLFKRLFLLMWVALVASHLAAYLTVTGGGGNGLPTLPSLPPTDIGGPPNGAGGPPPGQDRGPPPGAPPGPPPGERGGPAATSPAGAPGPRGMPTSSLVLDYAVRLFIIGIAAYLGARWLSRPVARLARASATLGRTLARGEAPPQLDEEVGTVEVRESARVFNRMAHELTSHVNARSLLVAAISHDLRTPLTRIRMRLEAADAEDPAVVRSISDIREMDALIESALEVFRGATFDEPAQRTDVFALVQAITDDLAELGQPVSLDGTPALAPVQSTALRRGVSNLVTNALRYGRRADVTVGTAANSVVITIDDSGPGIPEAQLEAVMQPFFRLDASRSRATGGSGLGLYIARDLVARQGGTLTLANRREGGLRATITLPQNMSAPTRSG